MRLEAKFRVRVRVKVRVRVNVWVKIIRNVGSGQTRGEGMYWEGGEPKLTCPWLVKKSFQKVRLAQS